MYWSNFCPDLFCVPKPLVVCHISSEKNTGISLFSTERWQIYDFFCLRNTAILKACCCSPWRISDKYTGSGISVVRLKFKMSFEAKKFKMSPATKSHVWVSSYYEIPGEFKEFSAWNKIVVLNTWFNFVSKPWSR